jgi:fumarate reductase subunit C
LESYIIEENKPRSSRLPARLDLAQSGTGLILGLFMWVHMLLVGSIILGKDAFDFVAKTMELAFLSDTGHGYPIAVFFAVSGVFTLFIVHALLGMRKFPISWRQHRIMRDQMQMMKHTDTNLWYIQAVTGFIMFFAGSVHLYTMLVNPGSIDPFLSAHRVFSGNYWFLYLILLICVELHATIGLYRLCMKWGWFTGKDAKNSRKRLKKVKNRLTVFFLTVGFLSLAMFLFIGFQNRSNAGEPYPGTAYQKTSHAVEEKSVAEPDGEAAEPAAETEAAPPAGTSHDTPPAASEDASGHSAAVTHDTADTHESASTHEPAETHEPAATHETVESHDAASAHNTVESHDAPAAHDTADTHGAGSDHDTEPMPETSSDAGAHDATPPATETH